MKHFNHLLGAASVMLALAMAATLQSCTNEDNTISKPATETETPKEAVFDFQQNSGQWETWSVDNMDTYVLNALTAGDVTINTLQGSASQPIRYMELNDEKYLQVRQGAMLKFTAAEGKSIRQITAVMRSGSFNFTPNIGEMTEAGWTGNATEVTLSNSSATATFFGITVMTAPADNSTDTPEVKLYDVEVSTIAEFNALEAGKVAKLTLNNVQVNGYDGIFNTYFIEDATGATQLVGLPITANKGDKLSGSIVGEKAYDEWSYAHQMKASEGTTAETVTVGTGTLSATTVALAAAGSEDNVGKLVKLENVSIEKVGRFWYAKSGDDQIQLYDLFGVLDTNAYPATAKSVTGIVYYNVVRWAIVPTEQSDIVAE